VSRCDRTKTQPRKHEDAKKLLFPVSRCDRGSRVTLPSHLPCNHDDNTKKVRFSAAASNHRVTREVTVWSVFSWLRVFVVAFPWTRSQRDSRSHRPLRLARPAV